MENNELILFDLCYEGPDGGLTVMIGGVTQAAANAIFYLMLRDQYDLLWSFTGQPDKLPVLPTSASTPSFPLKNLSARWNTAENHEIAWVWNGNFLTTYNGSRYVLIPRKQEEPEDESAF